jgi:hypothetical protein
VAADELKVLLGLTDEEIIQAVNERNSKPLEPRSSRKVDAITPKIVDNADYSDHKHAEEKTGNGTREEGDTEMATPTDFKEDEAMTLGTHDASVAAGGVCSPSPEPAPESHKNLPPEGDGGHPQALKQVKNSSKTKNGLISKLFPKLK